MNYFGMATTILSHIAAALYMEKPKYNKFVTASLWTVFTIFSICIMLLQQNVQYTFFSMLIAQLIIFFISAKGPVGEKFFLFLTYVNLFCICIGARLFLLVFLGNCAYMPIYETGILILMHMILYKYLIPTYKKVKIFFQSGWLKINIILVFFFIQFLNQYAFTIVDKQNASSSLLDFVIFSIIFYSTLTFIFSAVKDAAEMNKKSFENNELKNIAYIDTLTNMKNRTAYMKFTKRQTINHRMNKDRRFISVVMDIDGFKNINDVKGHAEGDRILKEVGAIISKHFESFKCEVFRVGGDEFVLLAGDMELSDVEMQLKIMNKKLFEKIGTTMSCGCSEVDFDCAKPFEVAFEKADEIMYKNKQQKKISV